MTEHMPHMIKQVIHYSDGTETVIHYRGVIVDGVLTLDKAEDGAEESHHAPVEEAAHAPAHEEAHEEVHAEAPADAPASEEASINS